MNRANRPESNLPAGMDASRACGSHPVPAGERLPEAKPLADARGSAAAYVQRASGPRRSCRDRNEPRLEEWAGQQQPNPAAKQRQNDPERRKQQ